MSRERTGRFFWVAAIAWVSMVGVLAVMVGVKSTLPGFRDADAGPIEMAMSFAIVSAVPFALLAAGVLAPSAWIADRVIRGRFTAAANIAVGTLFSVPSILVFLVGNWVLFGRGRSFSAFLARVRNPPDSLIGLLIVFAVGGIIMSLAMRHRERA